jgi:mannose/fructose-specific phosphotransferase system component IIA
MTFVNIVSKKLLIISGKNLPMMERIYNETGTMESRKIGGMIVMLSFRSQRDTVGVMTSN